VFKQQKPTNFKQGTEKFLQGKHVLSAMITFVKSNTYLNPNWRGHAYCSEQTGREIFRDNLDGVETAPVHIIFTLTIFLFTYFLLQFSAYYF